MLNSHRTSLIVVIAIFVGVLGGLIIASNLDWTLKSKATENDDSSSEIMLGSDEPVS